MKVCSVDGCGLKHSAKGLCLRHYNAEYKKFRRANPEFRTQELIYGAAHIAKRRKTDPKFRQADKARTRRRRNARRRSDVAFITKEHIRRNVSKTKQRHEDPLFRFRCNISTLIRGAFRRLGHQKTSRTIQLLGCPFEIAMERIGWFPGCEIHHIVPLETARTEEDVVRLNRYDNLIAVTPKQHKIIHRLIDHVKQNGSRSPQCN